MTMSLPNHAPTDFAIPIPLTLAQDNQAIPGTGPGGAPGPTGTPATPGAGNGATGTPPGSGAPRGLFDSSFVFIMIAVVILMMVVMSAGQRRERKKREALIAAVKKHDRVQTIGGVIGSVVEIKPEYIVLKVDESSNTRITFSRSAIAQVLTAAPESAGTGKEQA